jgi:hypothetical protein
MRQLKPVEMSLLPQDEEGDTPNLQPRASSEEAAPASAGGFAFHQPSPGVPALSPEILGYEEQREIEAFASSQEPAFLMPRSALLPGRGWPSALSSSSPTPCCCFASLPRHPSGIAPPRQSVQVVPA